MLAGKCIAVIEPPPNFGRPRCPHNTELGPQALVNRTQFQQCSYFICHLSEQVFVPNRLEASSVNTNSVVFSFLMAAVYKVSHDCLLTKRRVI